MSDSLITGLLLVGIFLFLIVTFILRKGRISMKFALVWYIPAFAIIILALFPKVFVSLASMFGFQTISNLAAGFLVCNFIFNHYCFDGDYCRTNNKNKFNDTRNFVNEEKNK